MLADQRPDATYGVICASHGAQGLSTAQHNEQLRASDREWRCPVCGGEAQWDIDREDGAFDPMNSDRTRR